MTAAECEQRADEESNLRRAKGLRYSATLVGDAQRDGSPWNIGYIADVMDDYNGARGELLMFAFLTSVDLGSGSETEVSCSPADAYRAVKKSRRTRRKSKQDPFADFLQ